MGIFTRKERIPEPYVSVALDDHCRGPILPGAQLSGNLLISSPTQRPVRSAEAVFSGRVTTSCIRYVNGPRVGANNRRTRRKVRYYDEVEILRQSQTLVEGISLDPTNSLTLPFSFVCPEHTNFLTGTSPYTAGYTNPEAYDTGAHALPPTLNHSQGSEHYAVVQYGVQLVVHFHDSQEPFLSAPTPIVICPRKTGVQGPLAEYVMPAQKYSSSRLTGQQKSFMGSVKDKFSSETPSVNIVLKAKTATVVPSGDAFAIQTCVEIASFSTPGIDIPVVEVCISELKLLPVTFFRALKISTYGWSSDRPEHEIIDEDKMILNASPGIRPIQKQVIASQEKEGEKFVYPASFEARIPGSVCPSFRTFNINRTYQLRLTLEARICEKVFEHRFEVDVIVEAGAS